MKHILLILFQKGHSDQYNSCGLLKTDIFKFLPLRNMYISVAKASTCMITNGIMKPKNEHL